jgi:hypothetical protein
MSEKKRNLVEEFKADMAEGRSHLWASHVLSFLSGRHAADPALTLEEILHGAAELRVKAILNNQGWEEAGDGQFHRKARH